MLAQQERAFQKQPTVFQNRKRSGGGAGRRVSLKRYTKNVGLGFKTPSEVMLLVPKKSAAELAARLFDVLLAVCAVETTITARSVSHETRHCSPAAAVEKLTPFVA